jgi:hypothetical protein
MDRASDFESAGCRFESCRARQIPLIDQIHLEGWILGFCGQVVILFAGGFLMGKEESSYGGDTRGIVEEPEACIIALTLTIAG